MLLFRQPGRSPHHRRERRCIAAVEPVSGPALHRQHRGRETLYDALWGGLGLAWQRTVQAVPPDRPVLVTSDHGDVFLGSGLSDPSLKDVDRPLEGKRFRIFGRDEIPRAQRRAAGGSATRARHEDVRPICGDPRIEGVSPSSPGYPGAESEGFHKWDVHPRHDRRLLPQSAEGALGIPFSVSSWGLTLMEMLRPWLELEPVSSAGAS